MNPETVNLLTINSELNKNTVGQFYSKYKHHFISLDFGDIWYSFSGVHPANFKGGESKTNLDPALRSGARKFW